VISVIPACPGRQVHIIRVSVLCYMFTGIILGVGEIIKKKIKDSGLSLTIDIGELIKDVKEGSSISVDGACLTIKKIKGSEVVFDIMRETVEKTNLGEKRLNGKVNLEPALKVGDEIGGHFVYGHIDGRGEVAGVEKEGENKLITIKAGKDLMKYIAPRGSVALDGVSLTVARLNGNNFMVSLMPYSLENTTLDELKVGDKVNLECDMLLKVTRNE
jgi:riboflavin synthase